MEYISSDTNIWLDFRTISRIDLPFRLDYTYIMYKEALRKEVVSPPDLITDLKKLGLVGVEITTDEFYYAEELASRYRKLTGYDRTALAIAKCRGIILLTGDNALRKAAIKENVQVLGTIGLLDRLYEGTFINATEYRNCLEDLLEHRERRLPLDELQKRIDMLELL